MAPPATSPFQGDAPTGGSPAIAENRHRRRRSTTTAPLEQAYARFDELAERLLAVEMEFQELGKALSEVPELVAALAKDLGPGIFSAAALENRKRVLHSVDEERHLQPALEEARRILRNAGLAPDLDCPAHNPDHRVRLHSDKTWADNLPPKLVGDLFCAHARGGVSDLLDLQIGEKAVTARDITRLLWGEASEQARAAEFLFEYWRLATLRELQELQPARSGARAKEAAASVRALAGELLRRRGLRLGPEGQRRKAAKGSKGWLAMGVELRRRHPLWSVTSIIVAIRRRHILRMSDRKMRRLLGRVGVKPPKK